MTKTMTGPHPEAHEFEEATVSIRLKAATAGASITPIDVEHPDLTAAIEPRAPTVAGRKAGGIFIDRKREMIDRVEALVREHR